MRRSSCLRFGGATRVRSQPLRRRMRHDKMGASAEPRMTQTNAISDPKAPWPDLPLAAWSETCDTLQLWTQIVGKVRIALTPLINHWWNATLTVTARGLAAPAMPYQGRTFDVIFDFTNHRLDVE